MWENLSIEEVRAAVKKVGRDSQLGFTCQRTYTDLCSKYRYGDVENDGSVKVSLCWISKGIVVLDRFGT